MDKVIRNKVAAELVKIARELRAADEDSAEKWQVWSIDCWGNQEDGWDFNDRSRAWTFECDVKDGDESYIQKCFEKSLTEHGCRVVKFEYDWYDENECQVNDYETGEYLWQIEKIDDMH